MKTNKFLFSLIFAFLMLALISCNNDGSNSDETLLFIPNTNVGGGPYQSPLPPDWQEIDWKDDYPGFTYKGLTPSCSSCPFEGCDPQFTFFARGGTSNNLLIFFDGGGACWHSSSCLYGVTYATSVDETVESLTNDTSGIADFTNPDNPFLTWNGLFIPYCTGDVHAGVNDYDYPNDLGFLFPDIDSGLIKHRGKVNAMVVLKWIQDTFDSPKPDKIFVTGSSAGAYGALLNFPDIKDAFPDSTVYCMPDAGNGVIPEDPAVFRDLAVDHWNIQLPWQVDEFIEGVNDFSDFTSAETLAAIANQYPGSIIAPYTSAWDHNQIAFYYIMLHSNYFNMIFSWSNYYKNVDAFAEEWNAKMYRSIVDMVAKVTAGNFRYYIGPGWHHTILGREEFYTEVSDGHRLVDWINHMLESGLDGLPSVACSDQDAECISKPTYPED